MSARFTFLGRRHDVPDILAVCDLAALPSRAEGFPNALLEYMACGLPSVATRVGGSVEIIRDGVTGLLVPPRDARALARAIGRLLREPELARGLARAGQEFVRAAFGFDQLLERLTTLYHSKLKD